MGEQEKRFPGFLRRLIKEKVKLQEKQDALECFIENNPIFDSLPEEERKRMFRQSNLHEELLGILGDRIVYHVENLRDKG